MEPTFGVTTFASAGVGSAGGAGSRVFTIAASTLAAYSQR